MKKNSASPESMEMVLSVQARRDLYRLPHEHAARIIRKLRWYVSQEDPLQFAKRLTGKELGTYRFRVGVYRVIFDVHSGQISILEVLAVKHRKDAYR